MRPVPISNPPNPWATDRGRVPAGVGAPEMRLEVFVDGTRNILSKNDSPDVGFTWSVNPYRGCFHALRLLLRAPDARVPELRRRDRLRPQDRHQAERAGAAARGVRQEELAARDGRLQRRHRLLPAAGGVVPADARLPRGLRRAGQPGGDHHQVGAGRARRRPARRARPRRRVARDGQHPVLGRREGARDRAVRPDAGAAAARRSRRWPRPGSRSA